MHNEFFVVVVGVPAEDGRTGDLKDVLDVDGDTEDGKESPGDGSSIGTNTSTEVASVDSVKVPAAK